MSPVWALQDSSSAYMLQPHFNARCYGNTGTGNAAASEVTCTEHVALACAQPYANSLEEDTFMDCNHGHPWNNTKKYNSLSFGEFICF